MKKEGGWRREGGWMRGKGLGMRYEVLGKREGTKVIEEG